MITSQTGSLSDNPIRSAIAKLEAAMLLAPQADIPVAHAACGRMKARTISIKAGVILTGAIHLQGQLNIMFGDILIITETGAQRYTGYHVIASKPGAKRLGIAIADTTWTTVLETDETDVDKIAETLTAKSFDDPRMQDHQTIEMREG